ncbi:MAG: hypothetical protein R3F62_00220 [Planctomycetota bacterium]
MRRVLRVVPFVLLLGSGACTGDSSAQRGQGETQAQRGGDPLPPGVERELQWVLVGRTPGKPLQLVDPAESAESIKARLGSQGPELVVVRNVGQAPEDRVETVAPLTDEEWAAVLAAFQAGSLASWEPSPSGEAVDWGEALLHYAVGTQQTRKTWIRPLENGEAVDALSAKLVELARAKAPDLELHYLR